MLHLHVAEIVKIRLPPARLGQIVGDPFGNKDVSGIAAIHDSLRDIDASPGNVLALVHVRNVVNWSAVNSHSQRQARFRPQGLSNFQCAFDRFLLRSSKHQGHAVPGRKKNELTGRFGVSPRFCVPDNRVQLVQSFRLLISRQLGVPNDVDEEDMRDLQAQFALFLLAHLLKSLGPRVHLD